MRKNGNHFFVKAIIEHIKLWKRKDKKLVIALEGISGIGKTTIAKQVYKRYKNITIAHLDQFTYAPHVLSRNIERTKDKPSVYERNWYNIQKLHKLIRAFRNSKRKRTITLPFFSPITRKKIKRSYPLHHSVLLVDGVFLQNTNIFGNIFDKYIFLTTDKRTIERRRRRRFLQKYPEKNNQRRIVTLIFDVAWKRYCERYHPERYSDLTIKMVIKK